MEETLLPKNLDQVKTLDDIVGIYFLHVFELTDRNQLKTAKLLGIAERTIRNYTQKYKAPKKQKTIHFLDHQFLPSLGDDCIYSNPTPEERDEWYNRNSF